jgi:hypothetical protein
MSEDAMSIISSWIKVLVKRRMIYKLMVLKHSYRHRYFDVEVGIKNKEGA